MGLMPPQAQFDALFDSVFGLSASATSALVPDPFVIAIGGHNYLHDLEFKPWKRQAMRATTVVTTRTQADTSNEPGEQSLSTESLWRRTQDSWHEGAGQVQLDRKGSSEFSFRQSKGVNIWTQWQLTLLNDTTQALASANTNLDMVVCGTHLYVIDGQALKYTTNLSSWTTVTGTPADTASSICTDGHTVWVAYGAGGVYTTTEGAATATQYITSGINAASVIRYVLGRLMLASSTSIYNLTASGTLPAALFTSNYSNFVWTDFTAGNGVIFASGNCGNFGVVYSIQINTDGASLAAPIICGQTPNGETIQAIYGYAGSGVAVGTSLGFRFAEQALSNGVAGTVALTIGPLFPLPNPVIAFMGYGRFIYGTYQNYDGVSTGLFRMDPSQFVSDLAPAYASDLMATTQGAVNSIVILGTTVVFSVSGVGVYNETSTYVASGTIDSGLITYGLADNKMPVFVDLAMQPLSGGTSIQTYASLDGGTFNSLGVYNQTHPFFEFATPQTLCQTFEIREQLNAGSANTVTPVLTRHTLRAAPAAVAPTDWSVVIQLRTGIRIKDIEEPLVPSAEYLYLDGLRINKAITTLQIATLPPLTVTVEGIDWIPEQWDDVSGELNGVCVVTCRTVV